MKDVQNLVNVFKGYFLCVKKLVMSPPIEEDEELEQLRIAALKSLFTRKRKAEEPPETSNAEINSTDVSLNHVAYYTTPAPTYAEIVTPVTSTLQPIPLGPPAEIMRRNRGFGRKFQNKRGRGFERHRFNSNLIAIVPVDESELSSTATDSKPSVSKAADDVPKLVLPQDRFYKTDKIEPPAKTTTEITKFNRFEDSSDESDELDFDERFLSADEEEKIIKKSDIDESESFEKVISDLEAAVQGNIDIISKSDLLQETSSAEDDLKSSESVVNDELHSSSMSICSPVTTSNKEQFVDKLPRPIDANDPHISDRDRPNKKPSIENLLAPVLHAERQLNCVSEVRTVRLLSPKQSSPSPDRSSITQRKCNSRSPDIYSPPPSKFARLKSPSPHKSTRLDSPSLHKPSNLISCSPHSDSPRESPEVKHRSPSLSQSPRGSLKHDSLSSDRSHSPKENFHSLRNDDNKISSERSPTHKSISPKEQSPSSSFSMTFSSSRSDSLCSERSLSPDDFKRKTTASRENSPRNIHKQQSSIRFPNSRASVRNIKRDRSRSPVPLYRRSPYKSPLLRARERKEQNIDSDTSSTRNAKYSHFSDKQEDKGTNRTARTVSSSKDFEKSVTFHRHDKHPERQFRVKGRSPRNSYTSSDSGSSSHSGSRQLKSSAQILKYRRDDTKVRTKRYRNSLSPRDHSPHGNKQNVKVISRQGRRGKDKSPLTFGLLDNSGAESNSDPILEARKRKFESNQPVVPTEKKIRLRPATNENLASSKTESDERKLFNTETVNEELSVKNKRPVSEWDEVDYDLFEQGSVASGWSDDEPNIKIQINSAVATKDLKVHIETNLEKTDDEDERISDGKKHKSPSKDKHKKSKKSKKKEKRVADLYKNVEDLRAELSRRRAERLGKGEASHDMVATRLIKSAFQSAVHEKTSKKSKKKKHRHEKSGDSKASKKAEKRRVMVLDLEDDDGRMFKFPVDSDKKRRDESPPWASKVPIHQRLGFSGDRSGRREDVEGTSSEIGSRKHVSSKVCSEVKLKV